MLSRVDARNDHHRVTLVFEESRIRETPQERAANVPIDAWERERALSDDCKTGVHCAKEV
jgi:hypothetical protein